MASTLFLFNNRPVDIVVNDHCIRYIELKSGDEPTPLRWGERYLPTGIVNEGKIVDRETLAIILEECIDVWKIKRRKVRFLVPDPSVTIRKLPVPADLSIDEIQGYLYMEIGDTIHLPFEDPIFDYIVLPEQDEKREILLFAAHREHVMAYSELFSSVKLKPVAADLSSLALYRLYHHLAKKSSNENLLIIQFDLDHVNMSIFENEIPFFTRHQDLPFDHKQWETTVGRTGFQQLTYKGDMQELVLQFEEVTKEINMMIDFYQFSLNQGKNELTKILLTGDHPFLDTILGELQKQFDFPIEILDSSNISTEKNRPLPSSHYLALGLALKEV
ncbi:type IV pilus assembly protein PilM [Mesobacillus persicus]|uniref:Type IV pilus assembly protein PilM n=1 Tax=Mesobacillus persicus TaxID=930146 RepID=A0A1H7XHP1_9BACI|nr:pilus assembly protein PilM [Mesobacillus persicus]SEM33185.1 type IV pilus assembly protein PilM [Mesobacillus persicus]